MTFAAHTSSRSQHDSPDHDYLSVVDAVDCAVDIQRGMAERNSGEPKDQRIDLKPGGPRSIPS